MVKAVVIGFENCVEFFILYRFQRTGHVTEHAKHNLLLDNCRFSNIKEKGD